MWSKLGRGLHHTRLVMAGSPPLYRLIVLGCFISAVLQFFFGIPPSIGEHSPAWFDIVVVTVQLFAALTVLVSLYVTDENPADLERLWISFNMEAAGLIFLQTVLGVSFVAIVISNSGPPSSTVTWIAIMFWMWVWTRLLGIHGAIKALRS